MKLAVPAVLLLFAVPAFAAEYRAVRASEAPVIDGDLSDPVWQSAPAITGFTQHDPDDGKPATQVTTVRVVYDNQAIYIGARLEDTHKVTTLLGRRDNNLESDWFRVYIGAQHDKLTGAEFWVNPANVQVDGVVFNDIYDDWSWDAVWQSAAKIVPGGWVVEMKIPYSQLRFPDRAVHTWGINFARKIHANNEVDWLVNTPKGQSGLASRFADLTGIAGIHPERALELMPYAVARSNLDNGVPIGDPLNRATAYKLSGGLDLKYSLTSNLRLTGTINPDFGQVEVDPAVINLSDTETFFPEKRPFFTEGASIFNYGNGPANFRASFNFYPPQLFYSRRIGRPPQGVDSISADYLDSPTETTILGAAKITGKVGSGWTIGALDAVTSAEHARFAVASPHLTFGRNTVEPLSNYFVGRTTKEYGNSRVGIILTDVKRDLPHELSFLRSDAAAAGVDGYTKFHKNDWLWEWQTAASRVSGSAEAIAATQRSSAHYFNRPDATYLHYDPARTSLSGFGGRTMLGKQTGRWRPNVQVAAWSPGFESNDVGYMPRADAITSHAAITYTNEDVTKHFRDREFWVGKYQNWNFGHQLTANGVYGEWYVQTKNYWHYFGFGGGSAPSFDDRKTRGGPLALRGTSWSYGAGFGNDSRKKLSFETQFQESHNRDSGWDHGVSLTLAYRPTTNLKLSIAPSYDRSYTYAQYVTQIADPSAAATYGTHYVFAGFNEHTVDLGTRIDWTVSSRLSFQLYMQPFVATGNYHDFRELARPRTRDYLSYDYAGNPDFDFRSVRGSAVARWEFRPGSALYVVWNENRADVDPSGDFHLRHDLSSLRDARSRDVFLVKVSYWLPM